ncbi:MAG: DUF1206 domain-containing protein [Solirubrobacteraceae bacterium]
MSIQGTAQMGQQQGEKVARSDGFEWLARLGLAARGVVYAVIAILALKVALGDGGKTTDQQGALKTIAQQSFGEILLIVVAIGLFGYALWRLVRAAIGHGAEGDRDDAKERIDGVASGIGYGILFVTALGILFGSGGGGGGGGPQSTTGGVLDWPAGQVLVIIAGLVLLGVAVDQGIKGFKRKFLEKSHTERMSEKTKKVFTAFGVFGHLARMVIFGLMGYFLIKAAIDYDPKEAVSLDGALAKLANSAGGPLVLGAVAVGLLGFGLYSFMDARYRRV